MDRLDLKNQPEYFLGFAVDIKIGQIIYVFGHIVNLMRISFIKLSFLCYYKFGIQII